MWGLIADTVGGISPEAVGQMLATLVGAGVIGGGGYAMGKARRVTLSPDPLNVRNAPEYASKAEVVEIKQQHKEEISDLHARLTAITIKLNELAGQQSMIIKILERQKSL